MKDNTKNRILQMTKRPPFIAIYRSDGNKRCAICREDIPEGEYYVMIPEGSRCAVHLKHFSEEFKEKVEERVKEFVPRKVAWEL